MKLLCATAFALFVLSALDYADSSAYDKIVSHSRIRARKEGPNVCALQQVMGTKKKYFSTCRNWYHGSICGKKAAMSNFLCQSYKKLNPTAVIAPIDHVYGSLGLVSATSTQNYADISKLKSEIEGPGSFTFFAPSNDAWDKLDSEVRAALVSNVNIELFNAMHYHMVNKRLLTKDLKNGLKVTSMYNDLGLHINHYSNGVVTVNCARIIYGNQVATNGVVHVIDRVITSVGNTIKDVIEVNEDLSTLSDMALSAELLDKLGQQGHFTLFAPTNDAFDKIDGEVMERLLRDKDVLKALLNYHLLDSVQCSEAIMAGTSYETLEGNNIEIGCDGESLTVNGIKMVLKKDIVTSNGVIHLIDQVLMPDSAKQVMDLLGGSLSTFGDMVAELGITTEMMADAEYTLLAPLNAAFTDEVMSMDQRDLKIILENHVIKSRFGLGKLYNGQRLETIGGKYLRVFIYRTAVCIENSCLIRGSKEGSNGALHLMRTMLKSAEKTMFEILTERGGFSVFLSLMEAAGLTDLLKQEGDFTLFAPSNKAFSVLSDRDVALLKSNPNALKTILLYHFSNGVVIGGGLESGVTNLVKSLQGSKVHMKLANSTVKVNSVQLQEADIMATNGAIHVVDQVLYPEDIPVGNQDLLALLRRLISYIQIKVNYLFITISDFMKYEVLIFVIMKHVVFLNASVGYTFCWVVEGEPSFTKVTRVVGGEPSFTKVTRVIEGEPSFTKVTRVVEGEPSFTKVTRVVEAAHFCCCTLTCGMCVCLLLIEGRNKPRRVLGKQRQREKTGNKSAS
uniref:Periostin, osteoblast specific factor b n=1 Tax=Nothobranchius furzeri TaxID=105023 RepID=A0A8C6P399_NOTFU